jgi:hypothetical protein
MQLDEIARRLALDVQAAPDKLSVEVSGGYTCDLLSYVMANARAGDLWITIQGHPNIIAVASLIGLAGVVVVEGAKVEAATLEKAEKEGIPLLATHETAYTIAGRLYELGVR